MHGLAVTLGLRNIVVIQNKTPRNFYMARYDIFIGTIFDLKSMAAAVLYHI